MKQIIALGGGGFSMEPENPALDRYVLAQAGKPSPAVCFLATASGDAAEYIIRFYRAFSALECRPSHLSLFAPQTADLEGFLLSKDVIYAGGGNTRSMLALWREWGLVRTLDQALDRGIVLAGISAGAICWFEEGVTDSVPGTLGVLDCLGFLTGSCCPHYDGEPERRPAYRRLMAADEISAGYGIGDGAALHFIDGKLQSAVGSRPGSGAWAVEKVAGEVVERPLEIELLSKIPE